MSEEEKVIEQRLSVVREYLQRRISHCRVLDEGSTPHERILVVTLWKAGRRTVRVSTALLSNPRLDPLTLLAGMEENDIAIKVLATPGLFLDSESVRSKAMARS
jgi:hypothetical protein